MAYEKFEKLMYKIAKAYYEDDLTQLEISKKFSVSRVKVGRMIKEAKRQKIVEIILHEPKNAELIELEQKIEKKYHVDEVIIVDSVDVDYQQVLKNLGRAAADYLNRILLGDEIIGLAWGYTVLSVVDSLPKKNWNKMKIVQLMGGLGSPEKEVYGTNLIIRAAQSFGAKEYILSSPAILPTKEICQALLNDPQIADTLSLGKKSDIAIIGLGSPKMTLPAVSAGILSNEEMDDLMKEGAVGDVCLHFINSQGLPLQSEMDERVVAISLDQLKKIPKVIGVAGGIQKYEIVKGSLLGEYIDVLITDSALGKKLLQ